MPELVGAVIVLDGLGASSQLSIYNSTREHSRKVHIQINQSLNQR